MNTFYYLDGAIFEFIENKTKKYYKIKTAKSFDEFVEDFKEAKKMMYDDLEAIEESK